MTDANGNYVFTGSITDDFTDDGQVNEQTVAFELTFDPDDGTPADGGTYTIEMTTPPGSTTTFSTADGSLPAGGPDPVQTLTVDDIDIVFSAVVPTTSSADITAFLNQTEAFIEANADYLSDDEMNVSTAGIGNDNNNFDGNADSGIDGNTTQGGKVDESFVVDPERRRQQRQGFHRQLGWPSYDIRHRGTLLPGLRCGRKRCWHANAGDCCGSHGGSWRSVSFVIGDPEGSNDIDAVQLFMGTGTVKIPEIQFTVTTEFARSRCNSTSRRRSSTEKARHRHSQDPFLVDLNV